MGGFGLERFRLTLYVLAPVAAVVLFAQPWVHESALRSRRYVVLPENDLPVFRRGQRAAAAAAAAAAARAEDGAQ